MTSEELQRHLGESLRRRLRGLGSPEYGLTWKEWDIGSGPRICALRASGRRTSGSGCGGWPTPNAGPQNDTDSNWEARRAECKERHRNGNGFGMTLGMAAQLAGWGSPRSSETGRCRSLEAIARARLRGESVSVEDQAHLASGPPTTSSPAETGKPGALNPAHSRWLIGYPPEWDDCAVTAMPSSRRSPRSS